MCDALAANIPSVFATILCNCLAHGRRRFVPDGHFKFPHLWPLKFLQAGRAKY
jgi:hypothetical protein